LWTILEILHGEMTEIVYSLERYIEIKSLGTGTTVLGLLERPDQGPMDPEMEPEKPLGA
jgi:hypothetical protein